MSRYVSCVKSTPIIPGVTPCCGPIGSGVVHAEITGPFHLTIDADCVRDGQPLMCMYHHDTPIYVFGTDWWKHNGGTLDVNAKFEAWCPKCQRNTQVDTWSWRG